MEPPAEATHCLVKPKEELPDDSGTTYGCEEDVEAVTVKEEWCDISLELHSGGNEQDGGVSGQDMSMVMPIKTELTLSDDLAGLHTQHQLAEHGSVPQVLKVEWEPKTEEDEAADCASTSVAPSFVKLATNRGNKVQTEEADTDQQSEQVLEIYSGEPDKRSFDTNAVTNINSLANCVVKLYDVFKTPKKFVPLQHESLVIVQKAATAVSMDLNCHVASHNEDIGPVTNKTNANNRISSKTSQSEANFSNVDNSENSLLSERNLKRKYKSTHDYLLLRHVRTHTGEKPYCCDQCDYRGTRKSNLVIHMRTHTGEKPYICKLCDYRCVNKSYLVSHMRTHTREKPFCCDQCDYRCTHKCNLVIHMRTHTGEKPYICELCDYKCARKSHLVSHGKTHIREKPFCCDQCDHKCTRKSDLVIHIRSHTGEKPYVCELCDYSFARKSHLVSHKRSHTGDKPFPCELCDYRSTHKSALVIHMRSHTGDKPFPCELCDYRSSQKSALMRHMRSHSDDKPFPCDLCNYRCASKGALVRHTKSHTSEKFANPSLK